MKTLIVIPTYNEVENIGPLLNEIVGLSLPDPVDVLVVDDNSPDGTAEVVKEFSERHGRRIFLLQRPGKMGLGKAYVAGFNWGLARAYDLFCEMDADFSHDPHRLAAILEQARRFDFVIGSRYVHGGGIAGWGPVRKVLSKGGSLYAKSILGCPVRDMTGGYNCWSRAVLEAIDLSSLMSTGYSFQIEMKYRAWRKGFRFVEVPILFEDRRKGASKMSKRIVLEAMVNVWRLKHGARRAVV